MLQLDGKTLQYDRAFTHNGTTYPANWLRLTTLEEKQAIGIVEVVDNRQSWDQRFYWGVDNPKDLDQLKANWTAQVKEAAGALLSQSDWYIIRQAECSAAIPADVLFDRGLIRTLSNEKEAAIAACANVAALVDYVNSSEYSRWEPLPPEPEPEPEPTPVEEPDLTPVSPEPTPEPTPEPEPEPTPEPEATPEPTPEPTPTEE